MPSSAGASPSGATRASPRTTGFPALERPSPGPSGAGGARGGPGARGYERRALLESLLDAWAECSEGRHLTQTAYAAWRLEQRGPLPTAVTLAKTFGSWPDARWPPGSSTPACRRASHPASERPPDEALLDQLVSALSALGEEASISQYAAWRTARLREQGFEPPASWFCQVTRFGSWTEAKARVAEWRRASTER